MIGNNKVDVLIYAEDPGAANYVATLPAALKANNISSILLTEGLAADTLNRRGIENTQVQSGKSAVDILDYYSPRLVIVGTSENVLSLGLKLIEQARLANIPSAAVVDLEVNADRRFRGTSNNPLGYAPDWLLVPDPGTRSAYEKLGFKADKIIVCGHPHYDHIRQVSKKLAQEDPIALRQRVLPNAPVNKPVIVFVAEPASKLNPLSTVRNPDYTLLGRDNSNWRTEIILQELFDTLSVCTPVPYLVVRLHPKNNKDEFKAYQNDIDLLSVGGDALELIMAADLIVGMTSMLLLEAALMEKPTLSIIPRASEKSWLPSLSAGLTPSVSTRAELVQALTHWINHWQTDPSDMKLKVPDTKTIFPPGSLQRVVDLVVDIASKASVST